MPPKAAKPKRCGEDAQHQPLIHRSRQTGAPDPACLDIHRKLATNHRMAHMHEVVAKRL